MCLNHQFMVSPLLGWLLGPTFSEAARRDELRLHPTGRSWLRWNQFRWDPWGTPRKILQIGIIEDFQGGNSMYDNVCMSSFVAWRDSELEFSGLLGSGYKKWWYLGAWRDCQTTLRSQSALGPIIFNLLFLSWSNDIQWLGIWSIGAFKTHQVSFPPVSEPRELVGWNQDSPTNWSSFVLKTPGLLASNQSWGFGQSTPQRMPVFLISYAM